MTTDRAKIKPTHLCRGAFVSLRQSTQAQLDRNPESTRRRYALVDRAVELRWSREPVRLIDEDLGAFGSGLSERKGFVPMTAQTPLLRLPSWASRSRSLHGCSICVVTHPLIGDTDGLAFDPAAARAEALEILARLIAQASAAPFPKEETGHDN